MDAIVLLILTIITAEGHGRIPLPSMLEPSIEKCQEDARAFFAQGIPKKYEGVADGLSAECRANAAALKPDERS